MFKKTTKFFAGVALLVQALSATVMFLISLGRKKGSAGAWLALAAITGAAGGYLVCDSKESGDEDDWDDDWDEAPYDEDEEFEDIDESELFSRNDEDEAESSEEKGTSEE